MAAEIASFFTKFFSLLILLLHVGCFISTTPTRNRHCREQLRATKSKHGFCFFKPHKAFSFLRNLFSPGDKSRRSIIQTPLFTPSQLSSESPIRRLAVSGPDSDVLTRNPFSPLKNDIFPCATCGEIFQKCGLLEQHQAIKHAVSELTDGDTGKNIVQIIFKTGWTSKEKNPKISRILKIHNSQQILSRFEEYRETVKITAARNAGGRRRDERCIADGNELLRFHSSTFICDLGKNGDSSLCSQQFCNVCEIIKSGFSPKLDGISTLSSSWRAHASVPEEVVEEFKFMNVKRAVLVCRVVAGRVGCEEDNAGKEVAEFDSVVGKNGNGTHGEDELLVFNPTGVLPCFVIVYSV